MLWRDLGYAIGAILTGTIADLISINAAIFFIGFLTLVSALVIQVRMKCKTDDPPKIWDRIRNKHPNLQTQKMEKYVAVADLQQMITQLPDKSIISFKVCQG